MAWSLVGTPVGVAIAAGTGTQSITLPGPPAITDLVLVATSGDISCADSIGSAGYTVPENGTGANPGANFGYKVLTTAETAVLINKHATVLKSCVVQVWRGGNYSSILDQSITVAGSGNSANPDATAIVTQNANALVVCIAHLDDDDSTVDTWPANYTNGTSANTGQSSTTVGSTTAICSRVITNAGSEDPGAFTMSSSDTWDCVAISFRIVVGLSIPTITETLNLAETPTLYPGLGILVLSAQENLTLQEQNAVTIGVLVLLIIESMNIEEGIGFSISESYSIDLPILTEIISFEEDRIFDILLGGVGIVIPVS